MKVKKFQEGGQVDPGTETQGQPAPQQGQEAQGGGNPEEQIAQMAQQIIQQLGPEASAMLAQMIMQMLQGAQQGGGEPQGQPQYQRRGGKLVMIGRKSN